MTVTDTIYHRTLRDQHLAALSNPQTTGEVHVQGLLSRLNFATMHSEYRNDPYAHEHVITPLASVIIASLALDIGRLDPGLIDQQVRELVQRCGIDPDSI